MSTRSGRKAPSVRNFVAKNAAKVCRAATHKDKKNDYQRRPRNQPGKPHKGDHV